MTAEDVMLVAATAAKQIVTRANMGGTDAVTYDGVRDKIVEALTPMICGCDDVVVPEAQS